MPDGPGPQLPLDPTVRRGFDRVADPALLRRQNAAQHKHPNADGDATPALHPFLLVAASAADQGVRPLQPWDAYHNGSLSLLPLGPDGKPKGAPVYAVQAGQPYRIVCTVRNLGQVPALMGIAEFIATPPSSQLNGTPAAGAFTVLGYDGFTALPGRSQQVVCNRVWTPTAAQAAGCSLIVTAYDMIADTYKTKFDAIADRHSGRIDVSTVPSFKSTWLGGYFGQLGKEPQIVVVLTQTGGVVYATITIQGMPPASAIGKVTPGGAILTGAAPFGPGQTSVGNTWTLSFDNWNSLSIQHQMKMADGSLVNGQAPNLVRVA